MNNNNKKKGGFGKLLAGISIGAIAGILFAPKSGSETRKQLKVKIEDLLDNLKEVEADEVKEYIETKIFEIREALDQLDKEEIVKIAKKKSTEVLALADELVDYAIEKGTPVMEETAASIRTKATEVTKEVLKKLEEK